MTTEDTAPPPATRMSHTPMNSRTLLNDPAYKPAALLDCVIGHLHLKNDAALCRVLGVEPPVISKIRSRKLPVTASALLRMHDVTGFSIEHMRRVMGVKHPAFTAQV